MSYFGRLTAGRFVLWCYLIWYVFFVARYFDPSRNLWLTSLGLSGIIGIALVLSTWRGRAELEFWTTFRLFLMPFCVSSFAALVKDRHFTLIFSPIPAENFIALGCCVAFAIFVLIARATSRPLKLPPDAGAR